MHYSHYPFTLRAILLDRFLNGGGEQLRRPDKYPQLLVCGMACREDPWLHVNGNLVRNIAKLQSISLANLQKLKEIVQLYKSSPLNAFRKPSDLKFLPGGHKDDESFPSGWLITCYIVLFLLISIGIVVFPGKDGDCSLIRLPHFQNKTFNILVDGGRKGSFAKFAWPYLCRLPEIDLVVLTHHDGSF